MTDLFTIDTRDYNPAGPVVTRPSARAIIYRDGKVLIEPLVASRYNRDTEHENGADLVLIKREAKVLDAEELLQEPDTDPNLLLLMEADLLDDTHHEVYHTSSDG